MSKQKKRLMSIGVVLAVAVAILIAIWASQSDSKIIYLMPDGSEFHPEISKNGSTLKVPDNPQMPEGWIFTGWSFSNTPPASSSVGSSEPAPLGEKSAVYAWAQATHAPVFDTGVALSGGYGTKGNRVTLPLQLCGEVNICAFEAQITYDPSQLKFVKFANRDPGVIINAIEEDGVVILNYLDSTNTTGDVALVDLVFQISGKEQTETPLEVTVTNGTRLTDDGEMEDVDVRVISAAVAIVP